MRFSLRLLLVAATFVAVGAAALASPSEGMTWGIVALMWLWLLGAAIVAVVGQGRDRAKAIGVLIAGFGVMYLFGHFKISGVEFRLTSAFTSQMLFGELHQLVHGANSPHYSSFVRAGHALLIVLLSIAGGCLAAWAYDRRETPTSS